MDNKIVVAISIGASDQNESLWLNGIKQNAYFLSKAISHCPSVSEALLFNIGDCVYDFGNGDVALRFDDIKDRADIVIELGGQISYEQTEYLKGQNCRLISYCCGFEYVHAVEAMLLQKNLLGDHLFINQRYDDLWIIPQIETTSRSYFEVLRNIPGTVVPFVWDPCFLNDQVEDIPFHGHWQPYNRSARISVLEPNINIVKFCLYPVLLTEVANRRRPDLVGLLQVTNTEHLANKSQWFNALMGQTDLVRQGKAVFMGRHQTPSFLASNTDAVVSHQWDNPLNYMYLEVAWQGYPLIHNAHLCSDLGYYYDHNDLETGASQLIHALLHHNEWHDMYRSLQQRNISRFLPGNYIMTATYDRLICNAMERALR